MTEADVWRAILTTLRTGLDGQGHDNSTLAIKQGFQPRTRGANIKDTLYLHKIGSRRIGHQGKKYTFNSGNDNFDGEENYWKEATYQATAQVESDISDSSALTSSDIAGLSAAILQTSESRQALLASDIGILRIGDVREPFETDDRDEFAQYASFDFILTYNQTITSIVPKANSIEPDIHRV